jgi:hypothetical protein
MEPVNFAVTHLSGLTETYGPLAVTDHDVMPGYYRDDEAEGELMSAGRKTEPSSRCRLR